MDYADWMTVAEEEYRRLVRLLADLDDADWARPTDCPEWTVHDVVAHLVGAAEATASVRELVRQIRAGQRLDRDGVVVDKANAVQVQERSTATPRELVDALGDAGRRGVRARRRLPGVVRALRFPFGPPLGVRPLGYLMGRIYTRDAWMHRIDIGRATGVPLELTPEHDGRLVADIVEEWADGHGRPFVLCLSGPAGGEWSRGTGGERLELDAIDLCRTLAGRGAGTGLLAQPVPF